MSTEAAWLGQPLGEMPDVTIPKATQHLDAVAAENLLLKARLEKAEARFEEQKHETAWALDLLREEGNTNRKLAKELAQVVARCHELEDSLNFAEDELEELREAS